MSGLIFSELKQKKPFDEYAFLSEAKKYKINKEITAKQKQTHTHKFMQMFTQSDSEESGVYKKLLGLWFTSSCASGFCSQF